MSDFRQPERSGRARVDAVTTAMTFDERYRAISSRDARFDGQFITAVHSTGIYCRPSCPARTPKPTGVTFYPTSAAAHEAGYRACKRCLPEAAPGSPAWNLRGDVAGRAMRLIAEGVVEREGVEGLAARLGYSSRHLTRLLVAELGAGPLALARAQRAHTARMLLVGTDLPASDVAFSAGFSSVRQFNDTMREVFDLTPLQLRARRRETVPVPGAIDLALPVRGPIDTVGLFAWMAARALPGVESAVPDAYARTVLLPGGPAWFRVRVVGDGLRLEARVQRPGDLPGLVARTRRLFDLDADPIAIDGALSSHSELAPLVVGTPGMRVPGSTDAHEMLIRAMIGQQVSVAAARTALGRLVEALGEPVVFGGPGGVGGPGGFGESAPGHGGISRLFPSMAAIADRGHEVLRGPAARVRAVIETAAGLASGDLTLTAGDDGAAQREALLALRGVGPWTADYVRMRVTGDPDVFLPGDVALRSGAAAAGLPSDAKQLDAWARRVAPWRSYLAAHLWRVATRALPSARTTRPPSSSDPGALAPIRAGTGVADTASEELGSADKREEPT